MRLGRRWQEGEGRRWLWGGTAALLAFYAGLAWRTAARGVPVCAPTDDLTPPSPLSQRARGEPSAGTTSPLPVGEGPGVRSGSLSPWERAGGEVGVRSTRTGCERAIHPLISVVVPARDEERSIRACVTSLLEQDAPRYEVIVVDDGSRDATPRLLDLLQRHHPNGARLRVVRLDTLPPGWAGKTHALHTGATVARGAWLLFTDADTTHAPAALRAAVRHAEAAGVDLLSLGTRQDLPDFWGRVIMPIAYMGISMQYPARRVNDPASRVAIANGQYILIRRAVYEALGGYAQPRLRGSVLDDRDLARAVKDAGYRLELADGRALVRVRMYHGLREHWRGWGKNAYAGSRGGPALFALMCLGLPAVGIVPFALPLVGALRRRWGWLAAGLVQVSAVVAYRTAINRGLGVPWRYAWTHPLGAAVFTGILARAGWRKLTLRGVEWSGRTYQV